MYNVNNKIIKTVLLICVYSSASIAQYDAWEKYTISSVIHSSSIDEQSNYWFSTTHLDIYDGNTWERYNSGRDVYSLTVDSDGDMWAAGSSGFSVYSDANLTLNEKKMKSNLKNRNLKNMIHATDGTIWVATDSGIISFDGNNWAYHFPKPDSVIYSKIIEDKQKRIWVSSFFFGVACYEKGIWTTYDTSNSALKSNNIYSMALDSNGGIWFSSVEEVRDPKGGLFYFDGKSWTQYCTSNSSNPNNNSYSITVDRAGYLWAMSCSGLAKFDGDTFYLFNNLNSPIQRDNASETMFVDYRNRIIVSMRHSNVFFYDQHKDDCGSVTRIDMHVPKEGKEYKAGTTLPILWATVGCIDSVTIEYRTGSSEWQKIAGPVLNRMPYHWTVPSTLSSQYQIRVSKSDEPENYAVSSHFSVISNTANNPPEFIDPPDTITIAPNSTFTWTVSVRDPDNDPVTLSFENITDWMSVSGNELTFTPLAGDTDTVITVTASDNNDGEKTISVCVLVRPPVSVSMIKNKQLNSKQQRIEIFDFRGKRLKVMENSAYLKNTGLSSGSYILKHMTGKNVSYRKFVVNSR
ncbi:MAG TPA: two-component regulator propeller domain-containing protein [Chitinispirillaceae bacterium]|nr:two-component regulator propeller domain-containing protein [Chitinispirillaceae bacterium]